MKLGLVFLVSCALIVQSQPQILSRPNNFFTRLFSPVRNLFNRRPNSSINSFVPNTVTTKPVIAAVAQVEEFLDTIQQQDIDLVSNHIDSGNLQESSVELMSSVNDDDSQMKPDVAMVLANPSLQSRWKIIARTICSSSSVAPQPHIPTVTHGKDSENDYDYESIPTVLHDEIVTSTSLHGEPIFLFKRSLEIETSTKKDKSK